MDSRGLQNLGNTCYLNATLQFLMHILRSGGAVVDGPGATHPCLWDEIKRLCTVCSDDVSGTAATPHALLGVFIRTAPPGLRARGRQQDAHEALMHLIDSVPDKQTDRWSIHTTTVISRTGPEAKSAEGALPSQTEWVTVPVVTAMPEILPRNPLLLSDIVRKYFLPEALSSGLRKETRIRRVGEWIIVVIGRWHPRTRRRRPHPVKLNARLTIDTTCWYLEAIVHHLGQHASHGHYVADLRNNIDGKWVRYDDSRAYRVPTPPENRPSTSAYLCAYRRSARRR